MIELNKSKWHTSPDGFTKVYSETLNVTAAEYQKWLEEMFNQGCVYNEYITYDEHIITINEHYKVYINLIPEKKSHGGLRVGAGRKKGVETENFGCRMKVENKRYLQQKAAETGLTVTEVLETIIETFIYEHNNSPKF